MHPASSYSNRTYQVQEEIKNSAPPEMSGEELKEVSFRFQVFALASLLEKEPYMTPDLGVRLAEWKAKYLGIFDNFTASKDGFKASAALAFLYTDCVAPLITKGGVEELFDYKDKLMALMLPILPRGLSIEMLFKADNKTDKMVQKMAVTSIALFKLEDQCRIQCQEMKKENEQNLSLIKKTLHTNIDLYRTSVADLGKDQEKVLSHLTTNVNELIDLDKQTIALSESLIQEDRHIQTMILKLEKELSNGIKK